MDNNNFNPTCFNFLYTIKKNYKSKNILETLKKHNENSIMVLKADAMPYLITFYMLTVITEQSPHQCQG